MSKHVINRPIISRSDVKHVHLAVFSVLCKPRSKQLQPIYDNEKSLTRVPKDCAAGCRCYGKDNSYVSGSLMEKGHSSVQVMDKAEKRVLPVPGCRDKCAWPMAA